MKTFVSFTALLALLTLSSAVMAGPAPGQPGLGARAGELSRSRIGESATSGEPYAVTGRPERGPRAGCEDEASLTLQEKGRCDTKTSVSHRRYPGGVH